MAKAKLTPFGILQKAVMYDTNLHYYSKLIYSFLVVHQGHKDDIVFPSLNHISKTLGMSRTTVVKYLEELEKNDWIERQLTAGKVNRYLPLHDVEIKEKKVVHEVNKSNQHVQQVNNTSTGGEHVPVHLVDSKNIHIKNIQEEDIFDTNVSKGMHQKFVQVFSDFYMRKFATKFIWTGDTGKQMKAMKELREKILKKIAEADATKIHDVEYCAKAFQIFLDQINSKWVLENLEPSIINSKFNSIYAAAKNKQFKSTTDLRKWVVPQG